MTSDCCNDVVFRTPCWYPPGPTGDTGITQVLCNSVAMVAATPMHGEARSSGDGEQPVERGSGVRGGASTVLLCISDVHRVCATAHTPDAVRHAAVALELAQYVPFELVVAGDDGDGHEGTVAACGALRTTMWPHSEPACRTEPRHTAHAAHGVAATQHSSITPLLHNGTAVGVAYWTPPLPLWIRAWSGPPISYGKNLARALAPGRRALLVVGDDKPQRNAHPAA